MLTPRSLDAPAQPIAHLRRAALLLASLLAMSTLSSPVDAALAPVSEEIIRTHAFASFPDPRIETESHLTFSTTSSWFMDPDSEIVTLEVTQGVLEVTLAEGSARIERHAAGLAGTTRDPVVPGRTVKLIKGDRVVVMRGYLLTVSNRNDAPASARVLRFQYE